MQRSAINTSVSHFSVSELKPSRAQDCFLFHIDIVALVFIAFMTVLYLSTYRVFPDLPLLLYTRMHSFTLLKLESYGRYCPELFQESRPYHHFSCLYCH